MFLVQRADGKIWDSEEHHWFSGGFGCDLPLGEAMKALEYLRIQGVKCHLLPSE